MGNFTKSDFVYNGVAYKRYTADRKRGGGSWVFYNETPPDTTYSPTWPCAVGADAELTGMDFISRIQGDLIHVDFMMELPPPEETALETLYTNHVAPVPI